MIDLMNIYIYLFCLIFFISCGTQLNYTKIEYNTIDRSYPELTFIFDSPDTEYLKKLKALLPPKIYEGKKTLQILSSINSYVSKLWKHDGLNEPENNDPLSILEQVKQGQRFRCVEYGIVTAGFLNALGIPSREVSLRTRDVETRESGAGHVLVESYVEEWGKWVMMDPQFAYIPVKDGIPLNLYEFQQLLFNDAFSFFMNPFYTGWIKKYLYYFSCSLDGRYEEQENKKSLMLVPKGAKNPRIFQIKDPIKNTIYTPSLKDFYSRPVI